MTSSPSSKSSSDSSSHHNHVDLSSGHTQGRPRAGSESSRGPVSKVMDMFRHRSHSAVSAEDKRKAVSKLVIVCY
jgi:5'-AMP-activated protein kinase regulatory gamma subunit